MSLIQLSPPTHRLPQHLLTAPGGFVWWYLDAVDAHGNGVVIIWSWGLPFLPGYASASRKGAPELPETRPSLNVVFYQNGKEDFYMLQEYAPERATWDGDSTWRFGDSEFRSFVHGDQRVLEIDLNLEVPGYSEPLIGEVRLSGHARRPGVGEASDPTHDWSPLVGPAQATMNATLGNRNWSFNGRGYHDRNGGDVPMHAQGIREWIWGRVPFKGFERIYYLVWPHAGEPHFQGLDILADGTTRPAPAALRIELENLPKSAVKIYAGETLWLTVKARHVVDNGPFYRRFIVEGQAEGQSAQGVGELIFPDKIDTDLLRPLIRMRVHRTHQKNSIWLPLFCGPKTGRVGRLLRSWR